MNGTLHLKIDGGVATITLDRPEARNALNLEMCQDLLSAVDILRKDESVRVAFLRGNGPAFCAGADLKERADKTKEWVRERRLKAFAAYDAMEALPFPLIAVVEGAAMGAGVEMCTISDFVVATPEAFFGTPEAQRGTIGATQRLAKIIGRALAKDMMYTGRRITAEEAREAGLVARVIPKESLEKQLSEIAGSISAVPVLAMRQAKRCISGAFEADRAGALALEMAAIDEQLSAGTWLGKK